MPNSVLQVLSIFFPVFCEVQTSIKREARQGIFHGVLANLSKFWENKVLNFIHFTSFISSLWKKDLIPEWLNDLFKEVIKNSEQFLTLPFWSWCLYYSYWSHFHFPDSFPNFLTHDWQDLPGTECMWTSAGREQKEPDTGIWNATFTCHFMILKCVWHLWSHFSERDGKEQLKNVINLIRFCFMMVSVFVICLYPNFLVLGNF